MLILTDTLVQIFQIYYILRQNFIRNSQIENWWKFRIVDKILVAKSWQWKTTDHTEHFSSALYGTSWERFWCRDLNFEKQAYLEQWMKFKFLQFFILIILSLLCSASLVHRIAGLLLLCFYFIDEGIKIHFL